MNLYVNSGLDLILAGSAMSNYYGAAMTVHVSTATSLIFSGSGVTGGMYVELYSTSSARMKGRYSGSLISGSALSNPIDFMPSYNGGTVTVNHFVFCPNLIFVTQLYSTAPNSKTAIIGVQTDGKAIAYGSATNNTATYLATSGIWDMLTGNILAIPQLLKPSVKTTTNKYIKIAPAFVDVVAGVPLVSGNLPCIPELYLCSAQTTVDTIFSGSGAFIGTCPQYHLESNDYYGLTQVTFGPFMIENIET